MTTTTKVHEVVVAVAEPEHEALYIDGRCIHSEGTVYVNDIVSATDGQPMTLQRCRIVEPDDWHPWRDRWPDQLSDLTLWA